MRSSPKRERFDVRRVSVAYVRAWVVWAIPIALGVLVLALSLAWFLFVSSARAEAVADEESELASVTAEIETERQAAKVASQSTTSADVTSVDATRIPTDRARGEAFFQTVYTWEGADARDQARAILGRDWGLQEGSGAKYPPCLAGSSAGKEGAWSALGSVQSFLTSTQGSWYFYWSMVTTDGTLGREQTVVTWKTDGTSLVPLSFSVL